MDNTKKNLLHRNIVLMSGFFLLAIFALIFSFLLNKQTGKTSETPTSGQIEKIVIGNIGEFSIFNLIAKEKGYFAAQGLDAEIREYDAGPSAMTDLLAGKVDVSVAADFVGVRNLFTNNDLRIITQSSRHRVFSLVARKDAGVGMPADLRGKKIGVTKKSAGEFYLGRFLSFQNLSLSDVVVVDLPPTGIVSQIQSGDIDAAVIFDPHAYRIRHALGDNAVSWSAQEEQEIFALTYSTQAFIQAHPDIIERYLKAIIQAEDFLKQYPEDVQGILGRTLGYDAEYVRYMWNNFTFTHGLDQELLLSMEDQARWAMTHGITDQKTIPNYLDYIYFIGLDRVKPEAITIIR